MKEVHKSMLKIIYCVIRGMAISEVTPIWNRHNKALQGCLLYKVWLYIDRKRCLGLLFHKPCSDISIHYNEILVHVYFVALYTSLIPIYTYVCIGFYSIYIGKCEWKCHRN